MPYPTINTGFLTESRPIDLIAGLLAYKVVLPNGDWREFCPAGEPQYSMVSDSLGCVSFSNNNVAEISLKQQGFDYNFSDRRLAKLSGTQPKTATSGGGNTFSNVQSSAKLYGRGLEVDWPVPDLFTWNTFYATVTDEVNKKAIFFEEDAQFISTNKDNLIYHLKQCPIQIAVPEPVPNHAVALVYIDGNTAWYFDSYPPYLKSMPVSDIEAAMKLIIRPKVMTKYFKVQDGQKLGIMVSEGYTATVTYVADLPDFEKLKDAVNAPDDMQTIVLPQ